MLSGIVMVAGCAVEAGMFSLPTVSSGMWFGWSVVCMLLSWFCMYYVSLMILEVNLNFKEGESFDTLVTATLGKGWNIANGLLFAFVLYILEYAYISGGGSIINHTLAPSMGFELPQIVAGVVFSLVFAFVVWLSTKAVARKINNVIRVHGGVSPLVGLSSFNNKSTRYVANLQTLKTPDSVITL